MILEGALYCLVLMIAGMLVFKISYGIYDSFRKKKPFEEIIHFQTLEKIIGGLKCPKDFFCFKSNHYSLITEQNSGVRPFPTCLEAKLNGCAFSVPTQNECQCKCPLRDYIARELNS